MQTWVVLLTTGTLAASPVPGCTRENQSPTAVRQNPPASNPNIGMYRPSHNRIELTNTVEKCAVPIEMYRLPLARR